MPRYLRWIVAATSGVTAYFVFTMLSLGIVVATGRDTLTGASAGILSFGAALVMLFTALAVNDWLASRYPVGPRERV